jgi:hypothetical protein
MSNLNNEVVKDVTTKKKYVKPDFEVIDLEDTPKLLAASGQNAPANGGVGSNGLLINNL